VPIEDLGLLFFAVMVLSLLCVPASIVVARYIGAIDDPVARSVHVQAVPRLGGLGMAFPVLAGLAVFAFSGPVMQGVLAGLVVVVVTGMADDVWGISPGFKMLGQIIAAIVFISISGLVITSLGDILNLGEIIFSQPVAWLVTIVCVVGTINAFNLVDGLDGLASGIVAIICCFFALFSLAVQDINGLLVSIAIVASVMGFLMFNSHPARLFMGDTGSLMLGFAVSAVAIILVNAEAASLNKPITVLLVLAMPVVDTLWVMCRRVMQGKNPAMADKTHLHHRLLALGLSQTAVVSVLYIWVALFGGLALLVQHLPEYWQLALGLLLSALLYGLLMWCEHQPLSYPFKWTASINSSGDEHYGRQQLIHWLGHSMKLFHYVILAGLAVPLLLSEPFSPVISQYALALAIVIAVAFPWRDHQRRQSIVHGLFYVCGVFILYAWNMTPLHAFDLHVYMIGFGGLLLLWAALKIVFKSHHEVFLTSSFELLLLLIAWFVPYIALPALSVSPVVLVAAKLSCLAAIPLLIAMKVVIRKQPHRNRFMAMGLLLLLLIIAIRGA